MSAGLALAALCLAARYLYGAFVKAEATVSDAASLKSIGANAFRTTTAEAFRKQWWCGRLWHRPRHGNGRVSVSATRCFLLASCYNRRQDCDECLPDACSRDEDI